MLNIHAAVLEAAFPARRMGTWRATLDRGQVTFVNDQPQQFSAFVAPLGSSDITLNVPADAVLASVRTAWGPMFSTSDLAFSLLDASGAKLAEANTPNQPGLTGKSEGYTIRTPSGGPLRVHLTNAPNTVSSPQSTAGLLEVTRVQYAALSDLEGQSAGARADIYRALRMFAMSPYSNRFRPSFSVTRSQLAAALLISGHVPQYLPAQPRFTDVRDSSTMIFVESAQSAPNGALFTDASSGGQFRPDDYATRLVAAVAFVRAAGLQSEVNTASLPSNLADAGEIPTAMRGYVAVALSHGFLTADGGSFRPQSSLTRAELAHAIVALSK
jgi:hypothetical protein